ncbi:hypothetical protein PLEOSDRAFT_173955 [Pleurotus ostreatus PC15]|uniref:Uncharacterized protein n=1 Tax=Pleurotus ostreatus (strain PC15) TaxID=1137138 RepID=A0A067NSY9_PLEO1|nr:hypothetical protein PLEOSDRAFT_173955 [Pleurotus ostreatus PC15]
MRQRPVEPYGGSYSTFVDVLRTGVLITAPPALLSRLVFSSIFGAMRVELVDQAQTSRISATGCGIGGIESMIILHASEPAKDVDRLSSDRAVAFFTVPWDLAPPTMEDVLHVETMSSLVGPVGGAPANEPA